MAKRPYFFPDRNLRGGIDLTNSMASALSQAKDHMRGRSLIWMINFFYLQGVRDFPHLRVDEGTLRVSWFGKDGRLPFKYPGALKQYMAEMGRLLQMDIGPAVTATLDNLTALRDRALAQVTLDYMLSPKEQDETQQIALQMLLTYGTVGLGPVISGNSQTGYKAAIEAIPPWELTPIPHNPYTRTQLQGIQRDRWVPLLWLADKYGDRLLSANKNSLRLQGITQGSAPVDTNSKPGDFFGSPSDPASSSSPATTVKEMLQNEGAVHYAHFHEVWLKDTLGILRRYIAICGEVVLEDLTFEAEEGRLCPIYVARYIDTGGFYGGSFMDLVVSLNREVEKNMAQLFHNARNIDQYGVVFLPIDMAAQGSVAFQNHGTDSPRIAYYEPSHYGTGNRPQVVQPATAGNFPGDVAAFGIAQQQSITREASLELPPRTDSPNAIQMIDEAGRRPITQTVNSISAAYGGVYRYIVDNAGDFFMQSAPVYLTEVDDHLAGIQVSSESMQVSLELATKPNTRTLSFGVRATNPRHKEVTSQTVLSLVQMGIIPPHEVALLNIRLKLGLPLPETPEVNTARTTMLNNILLFNDGLTPGQPIGNVMVESPRVAMQIIATFMSRPIFKLASLEVRRAFEQFYEGYRSALTIPRQSAGPMLPEDIMEAAGQPPQGGPPNGSR